ncbi:hypothetical protein KPK_5469 [Klebsiella variicola]|uniref:Uncharacterized protein n=1 Tax=Klebsiella variicola (strain 342) TaxID=507522 RepID=B5XZ53_KLEV3|nr:hypothetical protein KPK_5469 [Klebsiella variicola]
MVGVAPHPNPLPTGERELFGALWQHRAVRSPGKASGS